MSVEDVYLAKAPRHMLAAKAMAMVRAEVSKGCMPEIAPYPVALEPVYQPVLGAAQLALAEQASPWILEPPPAEDELVRFQAWISPDQRVDWVRSELFLKQLVCLRHRAAMEIVGNQAAIAIRFLCHRDGCPVLRAAFLGQFEQCALSAVSEDRLAEAPLEAWDKVVFGDFLPPLPYSHLFTTPDELKRSPYTTLTTALADIPPPAIGIYQVVFEAVPPDHDWHQNVQALLDLEFNIKLTGGGLPAQRYAQQAPSGDLRQMATDVMLKAHNDKPLFAAALRIGVLAGTGDGQVLLQSLLPVASLVQHGGRPLGLLAEEEYRAHLSAEAIRTMFVCGTTHRPGFLLNSWELTSLAHIPPPETLEHLKASLPLLETLPPDAALSEGVCIGHCEYAGVSQRVCIPDKLRSRHALVIGGMGSGKSSLIEQMITQDLRRGHGVAVIDPHGTLVDRILALVPKEHVDRVIYLKLSDPDWVPVWNPLQCRSSLGHGLVADDLVSAFKSFVDGWGDRLEHLLRHATLALAHLPGASLLDVSDLLRQKSPESEQLRDLIVKTTDSEVIRTFWAHDFKGYGRADLTPPQHKLSKLLTSGTASLMLSQTDSSFDLAEVMDSGKILLVDLSKVGTEVQSILGCFLLSLLYQTAMVRQVSLVAPLLPFHIYCDEAHRFMTDAMEDMIGQTRKFGVSLTVAHQYRGQFEQKRKADALLTVGTTVIFNVNSSDAQQLVRGLRGKVEVDDLVGLEDRQAIARIGTHVVRLRTADREETPVTTHRDLIIQRSRERYCKQTPEVQRAIRRRHERWAAPLRPRDSLDGRPTAVNPAGQAPNDGRDNGAHPPELNDFDRW